MAETRRSTPALEVKGLDVYYGHSHALQGVDLTLDSGVFSVVGRNGMGKTTLCKTIMGLVRASGGSVRIRGEEATGLSPARIARLGVGYVPQGRRLWRSLSVNEHLELAAGMRRGPWTIERIYETFPRLAERKDHGGSQLSGGEQQMLAISRALLTNPHLLIMDEPTEGLAPVIVAQVEEMLVRLGEDGDMSVLVIEQNIGVATAISRNVAIMVNGRVNRIIDSARLAADRDLQQRLLGVGLRSDIEPDLETRPERTEAGEAPQPARSKGPVRIFISNPTLPTRWSQPVPIARIEAAARTVSTGVTRLDEVTRQRREPATTQTSGPPVVLVVGTLDTKGAELRFIRDTIADSGLRTRLVDVSTSGKASACDVSAQEIALNHGRGGSSVFGADRGRFGDSHGGCLCQVAAPPGECRRHHLRGRFGRHFAGRARHARPARRRSENDRLVGGLGRCRPLCRTCRHHDDVFGDRRAGPQFDLAYGARATARTRLSAWSRHASTSARPGDAMRALAFPPSVSPCSA